MVCILAETTSQAELQTWQTSLLATLYHKIPQIVVKGRSSLYLSQVAHQAETFLGFLWMKRPGVFLLPSPIGWDANPISWLPH